MNRQLLQLFAAGALMFSTPAYSETAAQSPDQAPVPKLVPNAEAHVLDNGMQVVVIPDRRAPVVTHMVWYKVGAADEEPGQSGVAHFLEHLMFKGTKSNPGSSFSDFVASIGGEENAFTSHDYTGYFQRVSKEHLGQLMSLESDRMRNLVLTDEVVTPELNVVLEERRQRVENDPGSKLGEALSASLFINHPYGRPIIGWMHEIEALNKEAALEFYDRYYTPSNAVLVVAGDVDGAAVLELANDTYGKIASRPNSERHARPEEPPHAGAQTITVRDEKVREPMVQRAFLAPSSSTAEGPDAAALTVLADVLGNGSTSRFYDQLVRDDGIATYAGAYYQSSGLDDTRFVIYGVPKNGTNVTELEEAMDAIIAELIAGGVTERELNRAKRSVVANAIYSQDSQQAMARIIGTALVTGRTLEDVQSWPARIQDVTAADVTEAAKTYLDTKSSVTGYLLAPKGEQS